MKGSVTLSEEDLGAAYEHAWDEWAHDGEEELWESISADDLDLRLGPAAAHR